MEKIVPSCYAISSYYRKSVGGGWFTRWLKHLFLCLLLNHLGWTPAHFYGKCIAVMPQQCHNATNSITMVIYSRLQNNQYHRMSDSRSCRWFIFCLWTINQQWLSSVTSSFNCISFQILLPPALQYKPQNININKYWGNIQGLACQCTPSPARGRRDIAQFL